MCPGRAAAVIGPRDLVHGGREFVSVFTGEAYPVGFSELAS